MNATVWVYGLPILAYLIGSIPFGYWIARAKGKNLFTEGSGNIGATNVSRVLGRKWGLFVFVLDFAKGVFPVLLSRWVVSSLAMESEAPSVEAYPRQTEVLCAAATFLGHLFPVYLGFRGGKGVATGAGAALVLEPVPALLALLFWLVNVCARGYISLASILAMFVFALSYTLQVHGQVLAKAYLMPTLFCYAGAALVVLKHRANIRRLWQGKENGLKPSVFRQRVGLAVTPWAVSGLAGLMLFFQFLVGPSLFRSFAEVTASAPSDRTAQFPITQGLDGEQQKQLGSALAGAAVGPMFRPFFCICLVLAGVALVASSAYWRGQFLLLAMLATSMGLAAYVSELRLARFSGDAATASAAREAFGPWHAASLLLNMAAGLYATILSIAQVIRLVPREPK